MQHPFDEQIVDTAIDGVYPRATQSTLAVGGGVNVSMLRSGGELCVYCFSVSVGVVSFFSAELGFRRTSQF